MCVDDLVGFAVVCVVPRTVSQLFTKSVICHLLTWQLAGVVSLWLTGHQIARIDYYFTFTTCVYISDVIWSFYCCQTWELTELLFVCSVFLGGSLYNELLLYKYVWTLTSLTLRET